MRLDMGNFFMNFDLRFCGRFALSQQLPYIVVIVMDWKMTPIRVFWPVLSFGKSLCVGGCNQPIIKVTQLLSCLCKNVKIANAVCRRQRWQRVYLTKKGLLCVCAKRWGSVRDWRPIVCRTPLASPLLTATLTLQYTIFISWKMNVI